jgi:hypothetical protein
MLKLSSKFENPTRACLNQTYASQNTLISVKFTLHAEIAIMHIKTILKIFEN